MTFFNTFWLCSVKICFHKCLVSTALSISIAGEMASSVINTRYLETLACSLNTNPNEISDSDVVAILLYSLMVESGFQPCASHVNEDGLYMLPSDWKDSENSLYRFLVILGHLKEYTCRLVCFLVGDVLECNLIVSNIPDALYSCTLYCSKIIQNVASNSFVSRFQNLLQLSQELIDKLIYPVKTLILNAQGMLNPSLLGVPDAVKLKIIGYLSQRDIRNVCKSCEYFNTLISDTGLRHSVDDMNDKYMCYNAKRADKLYGRMMYMKPGRPMRRLRIKEPLCMCLSRFYPDLLRY